MYQARCVLPLLLQALKGREIPPAIGGIFGAKREPLVVTKVILDPIRARPLVRRRAPATEWRQAFLVGTMRPDGEDVFFDLEAVVDRETVEKILQGSED